MSAAKFIEIFKSASLGGDTDRANAYSSWKSKNRTWANNSRKELEAFGVSKTVGLAISQDMAKTLGISEEFNKLTTAIKAGKPNRGPYLDENNGTPLVVFPGVAFEGGVERTLDKFFGKGTSDKAKELGLVKGHVIGFATGALLGTKESIQASTGIAKNTNKEELASALVFLDVLIDHLRDMDIASAAIKNFDSKILAKYSKSSKHFLVELQLSADNSESAKAVAALAGRTINASTGIRGLLTPGGVQKSIVGKLTELLKKQGLTDPEKLLAFESSPPMLKLIEDEIVSKISGKPKKLAEKYSGNVDIGNIVQLYANTKEQADYRAKLKKASTDASVYKAKLKSRLANPLRTFQGQFYSLASLQLLINEHLPHVLAANMGNGNRKDILNYRTGRFATSAKVERMSQSREGMITAFYSYMKNPYQTFEPEFRQGSPASRDPKSIISKSIREIAATKIANRMRAVVI